MGITKFSYDLLLTNDGLVRGKKMLELGDQNLYFQPVYGQFAKQYFRDKYGIDHTSVDLSAHEGGAEMLDLALPADKWKNTFDVITDFGTSEHVGVSLYHCFKNCHDMCKPGGIMFHENPKTGNWPGHGAHYFTNDFYVRLAELCNYRIMVLGENAAMGNTNDGWNIHCVLIKNVDNEFISEEGFNSLDFKKK